MIRAQPKESLPSLEMRLIAYRTLPSPLSSTDESHTADLTICSLNSLKRTALSPQCRRLLFPPLEFPTAGSQFSGYSVEWCTWWSPRRRLFLAALISIAPAFLTLLSSDLSNFTAEVFFGPSRPATLFPSASLLCYLCPPPPPSSTSS